MHGRATGERPKVAVWTPQQTGEFLDFATSDRHYAMYHLIAFRGLRRGEAVGLRWADVDLDEGVAHINQQIVQLGWATEIAEPKAHSVRAIALDEQTVAALKAHRARQSAERLAAGSAWANTGLVFTREDGAALHPDFVTNHFKVLVRRAGLLQFDCTTSDTARRRLPSLVVRTSRSSNTCSDTQRSS